jgi:bifunctional DNase/RNase
VYNKGVGYSTATGTKERVKEIMVEMTVESVRINLATQQRVVILKATKQERYLFIWIAHAEAYAIAVELQGTTSPRPLTHDLLKNIIGELGAKIVSIVISDLIDEIYYARIVLDVAGRHVEIDSRPSDAIALAVRAKTPIFVEESVLDRAGVALEQSEEKQTPMNRPEPKQEEEADNLDAYRDFINTLDVLDEFGKD